MMMTFHNNFPDKVLILSTGSLCGVYRISVTGVVLMSVFFVNVADSGILILFINHL
jgi:hypothetical protein